LHDTSKLATLPNVCRFWAAGQCAHGERCAFSHAKVPVQTARAPSVPLRTVAPDRPSPRDAQLAAVTASIAQASVSSATIRPSAQSASHVRAAAQRQYEPTSARPWAPHENHTPTAAAIANDPRATASTPDSPPAELHADLQCGVCLEPMVATRCRFGLLQGCDHAFCLECLRQWRSTHAIRPDVARSCPECRAPSHYVVPSAYYATGARKLAIIQAYLTQLRGTPCKHFAFGEGTCPFGSSCFYAHLDRTGRRVYVEPRKAYGKSGATVLPNYRLSDHLFPDDVDGGAGRTLLDSIPLVPSDDVAPTPAPRGAAANLDDGAQGPSEAPQAGADPAEHVELQ
jgi:E3 ubiquitin-protein ligase makorin